MSAYMEMIYIDSEHHARKTGIGAEFDTDRLTRLAFESIRRLAVPIETAMFIVDYYEAEGGLTDTIGVTAEGFREITGRDPLDEEDYVRGDAAYWIRQRVNIAHARQRPHLTVVA